MDRKRRQYEKIFLRYVGCGFMSQLVVTLVVDNATPGQAIGIKEAIAMDLEKYGDVRVVQVDVRDPEQLSVGFTPNAGEV